MQTDALLERLADELKPVRRRSIVGEAAVLAILGLAEVGLFIGLGFMRPDMPGAMDTPAFWWKLASMGLIAVLGVAVALISMDPARSPRQGLRWILGAIAASFASGWLIDSLNSGFSVLLARLDWMHGVQCVWEMAFLSLPAVVALGILLRRGAPTDRSGTALAAGLASAAWGAFVFVFACPFDDPLYIAVWYTVGCSIMTAFGRAVLLQVTRW